MWPCHQNIKKERNLILATHKNNKTELILSVKYKITFHIVNIFLPNPIDDVRDSDIYLFKSIVTLWHVRNSAKIVTFLYKLQGKTTISAVCMGEWQFCHQCAMDCFIVARFLRPPTKLNKAIDVYNICTYITDNCAASSAYLLV